MRQIIIKNIDKYMQPLDEKFRNQFFRPVHSPLTITIRAKDRSNPIYDKVVAGQMFSSKEMRDKVGSWDIETPMLDYKFIREEGLQKFLQYLVSGFLQTNTDNIWKYFMLACAFKSEQFIIGMMKHTLLLGEEKEVIEAILSTYFRDLQRINWEGTSFLMWIITNNPHKFRIRDLVRKCEDNILIEVLECKAKTNNLSLTELKDLERELASKQKKQLNQHTQLRYLIPEKYLSVEMAEYFRGKLYDEPQFLGILKMISKNLNEKQEQIEKFSRNLKEEVQSKSKQLQAKKKQLYVSEFEIVIAQQRSKNPHRYVNRLPNPRQAWADKEPQHKPQPKTSPKQQMDEIDRAIKMSLQENPKHVFNQNPAPKISIRNVRMVGSKLHDQEGCEIKERIQLQCGDEVCVGCIQNRYFDTTRSHDLDKPLEFRKSQQSNVVCWVCRKSLTQSDIKAINNVQRFDKI